MVFRFISTGTPKELKNYIVKSDKIENAYKAAINANEEFKIYKIEVRSPFTMGDAMFAENVLYLESAENLQFTLRCKNSAVERLVAPENDNGLSPPFKFYLKVSDTSAGADELGYIILEPVNGSIYGKNTDRYRYFTSGFDGVKIDYVNSKVEFYVFLNSVRGDTIFDEGEAAARFTVFDINMPKKKIPAKRFKLLS